MIQVIKLSQVMVLKSQKSSQRKMTVLKLINQCRIHLVKLAKMLLKRLIKFPIKLRNTLLMSL